jgi:hypothetical protein
MDIPLWYIEKDWIDEKSGRFSPIITDFNRKTQPIIRYKLDDILKYPEGVLKRFKPEGATITNKRVSQNRISFNATKTIMFISKTVMVQGTLDSNENNRGCAANESGSI